MKVTEGEKLITAVSVPHDDQEETAALPEDDSAEETTEEIVEEATETEATAEE